MISILVKDSLIREKLRKHLVENGIETRPTFHPVHTMPMYTKSNYKFPIADNLGTRGINLPSYPGLTKKDIKFISNTIRNFYERD